MVGGGPVEPLSDVEALLWGLEGSAGPLRAVITVVALLERSPGIDRLRRRAETVSTHLPRMRQQVVGAAGPAGNFSGTPLRWADVEDFDISGHVGLVPGAGDGPAGVAGLSGLLADVASATTAGMARDRPPWDMTLVEGVSAGGEAALVIRLHHVCTDGVGALRLAAILFDLSSDASEPAPAPLRPPGGGGPVNDVAAGGRPPPAGPDGRHRPPWAEAGVSLTRGLGVARQAWPVVAAHARDAVAAPQPRAQATVDLLRSVARLANPTARALSPVMTRRSVATGLATLDVDLDQMAAQGRAAGGTINDVFIAGVIAGLQRYHAALGHRPDALRVGVPINLRTDATPDDVSNAFAAARITAPLQVSSPPARIRAVHQLILRERHQPANAVLGPLAGVVNRVPGIRPAMGSALASIDVMASNVPGPPVPLWLGGARVLAIYPFGPRSGAALNLTLLSHEGIARIGVHLDPAAIPDESRLVDCLRRGFSATLA